MRRTSRPEPAGRSHTADLCRPALKPRLRSVRVTVGLLTPPGEANVSTRACRAGPLHLTSLLGPSAAHAQQPVLSRGQGIAPSFVAHRGPARAA
jgi:hypothetical protein